MSDVRVTLPELRWQIIALTAPDLVKDSRVEIPCECEDGTVPTNENIGGYKPCPHCGGTRWRSA